MRKSQTALGCIWNHDYLKINMVVARWVLHFLTIEDKKKRVGSSKTLLQMEVNDTYFFFKTLVTMDEIWIYYFEPEQKKMFIIYWKTPFFLHQEGACNNIKWKGHVFVFLEL